MRAHAAELVDSRLPADDDPIVYLHMSGQTHVTGQNGLAAHLYIVRDMHG